jgi:uncharacterized SAM-binding protein YcdF (DUF218 family)
VVLWSRRRWLVRLGCLALGCLSLYLFRAPVLRGIANRWIVSEPLAKADAIVVLGGGTQYRPFEAARLYHAGFAPKIIVMKVQAEPTDELGVTLGATEAMKRVLINKGVPEDAIVLVGDAVSATRDEAVAVSAWAEISGAKRFIIPTDLFHTRRVRWLFGKMLKPAGAQVQVEAVDPGKYTAADWWRHEEGVVTFQNEVIKYLYYRLKY